MLSAESGRELTAEDLDGHCAPSVSPVSVRGARAADGAAGAPVEPGALGEIAFAGPQAFRGYLGNAAATGAHCVCSVREPALTESARVRVCAAASLTTDGLVYTGDVGSLTPSGGLRIVGRAGRMLKPRGFLVHPDEVEAFFTEHAALAPLLRECACVGVPDPRFQHAIFLFVIPQRGPHTAADVEAACRRAAQADLTTYKRPAHYAVLAADAQFPRNRLDKRDYQLLEKQALALATPARL